MKYDMRPFDVIPADIGRAFYRCAYEGQMAMIICVTAVAPPALCTPNQNKASIPLEATQK